MNRLSSLAGANASTLFPFACVGALTTTLDWVIFSVLVTFFSLFPAEANIVSYSCGIATSFMLNRLWVFGHVTHQAKTHVLLGRFILTNGIGLTLSTLVVAAFAMVLPDPIAKVASVPLVFGWNYGAVKLWVFR